MTKQVTTLTALFALLTLTGVQKAWAIAEPSNDQDSITITITPNVDRGVEIDSTTVSVDLGAVALGGTAQTVRPATVTILGTLTNQELQVTGTIAPDWSFDTTPTVDTFSNELDALAFYLLFSDTSLSQAPTGADFSADNGEFTGASLRAGGDVGGGVTFEKQGNGAKDMDARSPGDTSHLWFFLRLPGTTTTGNAQSVQITLTAVTGS